MEKNKNALKTLVDLKWSLDILKESCLEMICIEAIEAWLITLKETMEDGVYKENKFVYSLKFSLTEFKKAGLTKMRIKSIEEWADSFIESIHG